MGNYEELFKFKDKQHGVDWDSIADHIGGLEDQIKDLETKLAGFRLLLKRHGGHQGHCAAWRTEMNVAAPLRKLSPKDYASDQEVRWCPGCGDYAILKPPGIPGRVPGGGRRAVRDLLEVARARCARRDQRVRRPGGGGHHGSRLLRPLPASDLVRRPGHRVRTGRRAREALDLRLT